MDTFCALIYMWHFVYRFELFKNLSRHGCITLWWQPYLYALPCPKCVLSTDVHSVGLIGPSCCCYSLGYTYVPCDHVMTGNQIAYLLTPESHTLASVRYTSYAKISSNSD